MKFETKNLLKKTYLISSAIFLVFFYFINQDNYKIDNIKNFWIKKKDGTIIKNKLGPLVNVNELPYPDYSLFEPERFYRPMQGKVLKILPMELHRGCPYTCAFCEDPSQNLLYKSRGIAKTYHRSKSPKRVIDELHHLINTYGASYIYFNAETFFAMPNRDFIELADLYSKEIKLPFWLQTRPETITEERIRLLKKMNVSNINNCFSYIIFGEIEKQNLDHEVG